ncbi:MAG: tetratricopeptide repeat protein [Saprospiraceae bacterium]|nr:tetratricopeptide repeat protein [Saprospiraceae bacterium]
MKKKASLSTYVYKFKRYIPWFVFGCIILLYANTLGHEFTQDDAITIYKNQFTKQGLSGISDIFTKDTFYGFFGGDKSDLVSGGRYRPLTLAYFAILWEIFGENPLPFHISSILMYGILCVILYHFFLKLIVFKKKSKNILLSTISTLTFAAHPIHTEVVANVKGLDEIWSLGFGLLSTILVLKFIDKKKFNYLLCSAFCLISGILAKENAITFLGIIPLTILFFRKTNWSVKWKIVAMLIISLSIYLAIRISVIGFTFGNPPLEMMNNPFMKMIDGVYYPFTTSEKWATIIYGLGRYVGLLFFPHPLTHDYYPRHFNVMTFADIKVILALILNVMIISFGIVDFRKKTIVSYSSIFYLITIALTCNVIFPIGTHLSERFLFTPSIAFALLIGLSFTVFSHKWNVKWILSIWVILIILFSIKTIERNWVWKSDYSLFTTDVHTSPNSAKVQNAAGGAMITKASEITNKEEQKALRTQAKIHLKRALEIHPSYKNAHLLLGNAHFGLDEFDEAIISFEKAIQLDYAYKAANDNLVLAYREGARYEGAQKGNILKAIQYLFKADVLEPGNYETISLLGIAHGNNSEHIKALDYFKKALNLQPNNAQAHLNLANVYLNVGNQQLSHYHRQQAALLKKN